jgi:hypothetical protein
MEVLMKEMIMLLVLLCVPVSFVEASEVIYNVTKVIPNDAEQHDEFGFSVAVDGDIMVVGSRFDDDGGFSSGSAYVFERTESGWGEQAKLVASDSEAYDYFGSAVAISGDTILVGAHEDGGDPGMAYVFQKENGGWAEQAILVAEDSERWVIAFGSSLAIEGDKALVGAPYSEEDLTPKGSAYMFHRAGTTWMQVEVFTASDALTGDQYGASVALSGDIVVIGAPEYLSGPGSVYVYQLFGGFCN